MGNAVIDIQGLNVKVGSRYLLRNINWQVNRGDSWVVFGMNGSGKTTLLSIIAGFRGYSSGNVEVFGETYGEETTLALRKRIGFVSSSFFDKAYSKEKAFDIVLSGLYGTLGVVAEVSNEDLLAAKAILERYGMLHKSSQPFSELSKGERQKILLARALIAKPELLILDEPGTGLDVVAREQVMELVRELHKENMTIIYVTHYTEEILDLFDQCLLLKGGSLYELGKTVELFNNGKMSSFLETPVSLNTVNNKRYISLDDTGSDHCAE